MSCGRKVELEEGLRYKGNMAPQDPHFVLDTGTHGTLTQSSSLPTSHQA